MRKLGIYELPLVLCLYWTSQEGSCGLDLNKFVLQENDTGDIIVSEVRLVIFLNIERLDI